MQLISADLEQKTMQFVRRMPYLKAIMLTELKDDDEVFRWLSDDLNLKSEINENFLKGLRGGINILYTDFKNQFSKLGSGRGFKIAVMYNQYFVKKVQIGENILMTVIAESDSVDIGQLDLLIQEFEDNFTSVDEHIGQFQEQQ